MPVQQRGYRIACGLGVAPPAWVPALERAIRATTWNTAGVMTAMACGWLEDCTVAQLEASKRADARQRQQIATRVLGTLLPELPRMTHPHSYFLWLPLPPEVRADQVAQALLQQHIAVSTTEPFATTARRRMRCAWRWGRSRCPYWRPRYSKWGKRCWISALEPALAPLPQPIHHGPQRNAHAIGQQVQRVKAIAQHQIGQLVGAQRLHPRRLVEL